MAAVASGQVASPAPTISPAPPQLAHRPDSNSASPKPPISDTIPLTIPKGTPIQVVLGQEIRVRSVGQQIQGHVVEPVYAFDKLEIPVGSLVLGTITKIEDVTAEKRTIAALDADFTPDHKIEIELQEIVLPDGKRIPIQTVVTPGSGKEIKFVTQPDAQKKTVKDVASEKAKEARQQARQEWSTAMQQVKEPGKMRRIERAAIAQSPVHPQYINAGTVYFAELQAPLDFGSEPLTPALAESLTSPPPDGSFVHALLVTPLSSATAKKGDAVEAILSRPLFDGGKLILPQGALLKGTVVQAESARYFSRNGQLRFVFHHLVLPNGLDQKVDAILQGVEASKAGGVKLDSEGGAQASAPKTRYLSTGVSVMLAMGAHEDDPVNRAEGGAGGFKLVGIAMGLAIRSQPLGLAMGALGASRSIYVHFLARGHEVVFPRNTALQIGVGTHAPPAAKPPVPASSGDKTSASP
jgi:hypothetical protein